MGSHGVLVTDGDLRISLAVLRSLAKKNIETCVGEVHEKALCFFSKYCKKSLIYPDPRKDYDSFIKTFQKIVRKANFDVLFPISDWVLLPVSKHRDKIAPHVKIPLPEHEALETTFDKSLTLKVAVDEGVPIPETFLVRNVEELKESAKKITYPAVVKPRCSWVWKGGRACFGRPRYVNSAAELISVYKVVHNQFPFPLIQEYIPGKNYSVAMLYNNSKLRAICGIKVHRTIPVEGGNSVFRESSEVDVHMKEYASRLLEAINWHGIAEVEFKVDPRDSTPKLMEINGRFWGSLEVAMVSGVDFPYLLYCLAVDGDVQPTFNYKVGKKCRWLGGDIKHLFTILKKSPKNCGIRYPNRLRVLGDFLKIYERNMTYDSFFLDDILPFFAPIYVGASSIKDKIRGLRARYNAKMS